MTVVVNNEMAIAERAASALVSVDFGDIWLHASKYRPLQDCMDCCHAYGLGVRDEFLAHVIRTAGSDPESESERWATVRDNLSALTYSADYLSRVGGLSDSATAQVWAVTALLTYVDPLGEDMLRVEEAVKMALWHDKTCTLAALVGMLYNVGMPRENVAGLVVRAVEESVAR